MSSSMVRLPDHRRANCSYSAAHGGTSANSHYDGGAVDGGGTVLSDPIQFQNHQSHAGTSHPPRPLTKRKHPALDEDLANNGSAAAGPSTSSINCVRGCQIPRRTRMRSHGDGVLFSRDEIERCSPSRRDGIDQMREAHLRYSYCAFIRSLGFHLQLPHSTMATAMVFCHRFFLRKSHACHDRYLIGTAALFLAAKSEETPCPLNTVLRVACEISHKHGFTFLPFLFYGDWFEEFREQAMKAETLILTTLDFELDMQHPYVPLTSVLTKLGLAQTALMSLAWNLVNEGLFTSLWLQFKPRHIAAGATFLAAKFLNFNLASQQRILQEFQTTPTSLQDVALQLTELLSDGTYRFFMTFV